MISHVVLMKFKPGVSEVDIEELEKILNELPNKLPKSTPMNSAGTWFAHKDRMILP